MTTRETTTAQDLDWLAFCYVTGELSAAEVAAFEERLTTDEIACEAVARVVELNLAVAAVMTRSSGGSLEFTLESELTLKSESIFRAGAGEPPARRSVEVTELPSRRASAALTILAAAAIAATMIVAVGSSTLTGNKVAKRDGTDRLVAAWAQGESVRNQADDDTDSLERGDDDLDPPDWMLAAVTGEEQAELLPGDDTPEVREN